jgi:L-asparaginase
MKLTILTTGGTIEKTYSEHEGTLRNHLSVLDQILSALRLPDIEILHHPVMNKDSLDMTESDRVTIHQSLQACIPHCDAVLILHGTDTLSVTGHYLEKNMPNLPIPVVLTGAMRPFEFRDTDAIQNVTESLLALRMLGPGVYVVMHNRVLQFPGVHKNRNTLHFERQD